MSVILEFATRSRSARSNDPEAYLPPAGLASDTAKLSLTIEARQYEPYPNASKDVSERVVAPPVAAWSALVLEQLVGRMLIACAAPTDVIARVSFVKDARQRRVPTGPTIRVDAPGPRSHSGGHAICVLPAVAPLVIAEWVASTFERWMTSTKSYRIDAVPFEWKIDADDLQEGAGE